ncbi:MAG: hypothetical protein ABSA47_12165 [Verrucomicrobiota bacterium]
MARHAPSLIFAVAFLLAGCATPSKPHVTASEPPALVDHEVVYDSIDDLVAKLSPSPPPPISPTSPDHPSVRESSTGGWSSGGFPILGLPDTAPTEEVVLKALQMSRFQGVTSLKILEIRQVHIPTRSFDLHPPATTAALVDTNLGRKIVLFNYTSQPLGWLSRVYEAKPSP